mgnify:CR=1 FL=1
MLVVIKDILDNVIDVYITDMDVDDIKDMHRDECNLNDYSLSVIPE